MIFGLSKGRGKREESGGGEKKKVRMGLRRGKVRHAVYVVSGERYQLALILRQDDLKRANQKSESKTDAVRRQISQKKKRLMRKKE